MDSSSPENLFGDRKRAIQGLIHGRELANQLRQRILGKPFGDDMTSSPVTVEDLVTKVLESFTETISVLKRGPTDEASDPIPGNTAVNSPGWDSRKSDDSEESGKSTSAALKERRGCYKRRKTTQTWTRITPNLIDDGHAWRKYGQKLILHATHPRNYYRCTHKFDQGCQATKQVQRTEDDPPKYRTTYHGTHTCQNLHKPPQIILDSTIPRDSSNSVLLSFGSSNNYPNNNEPRCPTFPLVKQEYYQEPKPSLNQNINQSSPSDYYMLSDLTGFDSSGPRPLLSSGSDHGDVISSSGVYSCTASTHSHGFDHLDMMVGVSDFDDVLHFEF